MNDNKLKKIMFNEYEYNQDWFEDQNSYLPVGASEIDEYSENYFEKRPISDLKLENLYGWNIADSSENWSIENNNEESKAEQNNPAERLYENDYAKARKNNISATKKTDIYDESLELGNSPLEVTTENHVNNDRVSKSPKEEIKSSFEKEIKSSFEKEIKSQTIESQPEAQPESRPELSAADIVTPEWPKNKQNKTVLFKDNNAKMAAFEAPTLDLNNQELKSNVDPLMPTTKSMNLADNTQASRLSIPNAKDSSEKNILYNEKSYDTYENHDEEVNDLLDLDVSFFDISKLINLEGASPHLESTDINEERSLKEIQTDNLADDLFAPLLILDDSKIKKSNNKKAPKSEKKPRDLKSLIENAKSEKLLIDKQPNKNNSIVDFNNNIDINKLTVEQRLKLLKQAENPNDPNYRKLLNEKLASTNNFTNLSKTIHQRKKDYVESLSKN